MTKSTTIIICLLAGDRILTWVVIATKLGSLVLHILIQIFDSLAVLKGPHLTTETTTTTARLQRDYRNFHLMTASAN